MGGGGKGYLCHVVTTLILLPTFWFENLKHWRQITQENIELGGGLQNFLNYFRKTLSISNLCCLVQKSKVQF